MMPNLIESIRVTIPPDKIKYKGKTRKFFDILDNTQGLTEEYLYSHQPTTKYTLPVYSTSEKSIGMLDIDKVPDSFNIIQGPAIIVARKGYAGRLFVVNDDKFIVHEDAYPIKPKSDYSNDINLHWFAGHYSMEFQSDRTSYWGIGDFPRERFKNKEIIIPLIESQGEIAELYIKRAMILSRTNLFKDYFLIWLDKQIKNTLNN